jgi:large subunit ribosomal protein L3
MWSATARHVVRGARVSNPRLAATAATRTCVQQQQPHHALQQQQLHYYSTSTPVSEIIKMGDGKLTPEEMQKIMDDEEATMMEEQQAKEYPDWQPGQRKRPLIKTYSLEEFEREMMPEKYADNPIWTLRDKRCGALGIKAGMMPVWDEWGVRHACTVLWMDSNIVMGHKTMEKNGYVAVQLAAGARKAKNVGKCVMGQYQHMENTLQEAPPYLVREFRVTDEAHLLPVESQIHARHFVPGQNIDISGISKGKGFQGGIKRHNFGGMPASHGTSRSHRSIGSTGSCQDPGKVFKGKKMPGRMGADRVTVQNVRVVKVDRGRNLLYVAGCVPGNKGTFVEIRDAVKKPLWRTNRVMGELERPPLPTFEYDLAIDGSNEPGYEEFKPMEDKDPLDPDYNDSVVALKAEK